jgi:para-nitrobenzyl esterase
LEKLKKSLLFADKPNGCRPEIEAKQMHFKSKKSNCFYLKFIWFFLMTILMSSCRLVSGLGSVSEIDNPLIPVISETLVPTHDGWVEGLSSPDETTVVFKGIAYAKPPIGNLRWDSPQDPTPWGTNIFRAQNFSKACPQVVNSSIGLSLNDMDEDCLSINVWKPVGATLRPVLVYIHGGAFTFGSSQLPVYDGEGWAKSGVVYVNFNYRVGIMGFFSHALLETEGHEIGNYGLMDQIKALQWVKANIANFGGDPNNITIMGSSAGGASVGYLMTSPVVPEGLFHRGIIESGGGSGDDGLIHYRDQILHPGLNPGFSRGDQMLKDIFNNPTGYPSINPCVTNFTEFANVTSDCKQQLLLGLSWQDLTQTPLGQIQTQPMVDDSIVTKGFLKHFEEGTQKDIPLIIGSNGWEASVAIDAITSNPPAFFFGIDEEVLKDTFQICTDQQLLAERVYGDKTFGVPARRIARYHSRKGNLTYLYFFNYVASGLLTTFPKGAAHHFFTPFSFLTYIYKPELRAAFPAVSPTDSNIANSYHGYWLDFLNSSTLNPSEQLINQLTIPWTKYNESTNNLLFVNDAGTVSIQNDLLKNRFDFIENQTLDSTHSYIPASNICP